MNTPTPIVRKPFSAIGQSVKQKQEQWKQAKEQPKPVQDDK